MSLRDILLFEFCLDSFNSCHCVIISYSIVSGLLCHVVLVYLFVVAVIRSKSGGVVLVVVW
jgi:hypothetical protein